MSGHIYIGKYSNGMIKVGKSTSPIERLKTHLRTLKFYGDINVTEVDSWVSERHYNYSENERRMIEYISEFTLLGANEWCSGIEFDDIKNYALSFEYVDPNYIDPEQQKREQRLMSLLFSTSRFTQRFADTFGEDMLLLWNECDHAANALLKVIPNHIIGESDSDEEVLRYILAYTEFRSPEVMEGRPITEDDIDSIWFGTKLMSKASLENDMSNITTYISNMCQDFRQVCEYDERTSSGLYGFSV